MFTLFPDLSYPHKSDSNISPILMLFSTAALALGCVYLHCEEQGRKEKVHLNWEHFVELYYPGCSKDIKKIYESAGLMPLIEKALLDTPEKQVLFVINTIVQRILTDLPNENCLKLIEERLIIAYSEAKIKDDPHFNMTNLKKILQKNLSLEKARLPKEEADKLSQNRRNRNIQRHFEGGSKDDSDILHSLNYLSQDLKAIHELFGERVFVKTERNARKVKKENEGCLARVQRRLVFR